MKPSERHHYIPEFVIKGFASNDGMVSVYNISKHKLEPLRKSPKQIMFEWNRNTFDLNGKKSDIVEKMYGRQENEMSLAYKRILEDHNTSNISYFDLFQLLYFIETIHWRVPSQDLKVIELIQRLSFEDIGLYSKNSDKNTLNEVFQKYINNPLFIELAKLSKSIKNYTSIDLQKSIKEMYISSIPKNKIGFSLLGDNPIILENDDTNSILKANLIYPISKEKILYKNNGTQIRQLTADDQVSIDILTYLQAKKMVCSANPDYLIDIVNQAAIYDSKEKIKYLKNKVFSVFKKT